MQDGYTQSGAGQDDRRQGGQDLQHAVQKTSPIKDMIDSELARHDEAKTLRLKHLEQNYKR